MRGILPLLCLLLSGPLNSAADAIKQSVLLIGTYCVSNAEAKGIAPERIAVINKTCLPHLGVRNQHKAVDLMGKSDAPNWVIYIEGGGESLFYDLFNLSSKREAVDNIAELSPLMWGAYLENVLRPRRMRTKIWDLLDARINYVVEYCRQQNCKARLLIPNSSVSIARMYSMLYDFNRPLGMAYTLLIPDFEVEISPPAQVLQNDDLKIYRVGDGKLDPGQWILELKSARRLRTYIEKIVLD